MRRDVRKRLIRVAKRGETITYGKLMSEFGILRGHRIPGIGIGYVVGDISEYEYSKGRPMISAIVVRSNSNTSICPKGVPGGGFFGLPGLPSNLRRPESAFSEPLTYVEQKFVINEQKRLWQYWKTHDDPDD